MRILGIDLGDKNIGLALSDPLGITAQGLENYHPRSRSEDLSYFRDLVRRYDVQEIVLGFPLRMDGTEGTRAEKTRKFARRLEQELGITVILWDERLTTRQSLQILREQKTGIQKRKESKDRLAAVLILSSYLESRR